MSATNHGGKGRGKDVTKTIKDRKNISSAGVQSKKRRNVSNQKDKDRPKSVQVVQSEQKQTAAATQPGQEQGQESELETFLQKSFLSSQKLKDREEQFMSVYCTDHCRQWWGYGRARDTAITHDAFNNWYILGKQMQT